MHDLSFDFRVERSATLHTVLGVLHWCNEAKLSLIYIYTICIYIYIYILANSNNSITAIHCSFWKSPQATQNHGGSKHYCAASDPVCFLLSRNPQWPQREVTRVHHCAVTISCNQHWVTAARTRWTCLDCLEPSGQIESNAMTISHISHISSRDSIGVPGP